LALTSSILSERYGDKKERLNKYMNPQNKISVAILLPVYNHLQYTKRSLEDLLNNTSGIQNIHFYTVLIDDGSSDGTSDWVRINFPSVHILKGDGKLWWSGAINRGAGYAKEKLDADYLLLWNNDIEVDPSYFTKLAQIARKNDKNTITGSKIYVKGSQNIVWSVGGFFHPKTGKLGMHGYFKKDTAEYNKVVHADWLTGMGTLIPVNVIDAIGYWDNVHFPQYFGDSDFTYRAKLKGYNIVVDPNLVLYNSTTSSGIEHGGNLNKLFKLFTDTRSKSNFKRNFKFYQLHATSIRAYIPFFFLYVRIFLGFFKWKVFNLFGIHKK